MKSSASVLIRNQARQSLLLQRSAECQRFAGCWEFPRGKADTGETHSRANAGGTGTHGRRGVVTHWP